MFQQLNPFSNASRTRPEFQSPGFAANSRNDLDGDGGNENENENESNKLKKLNNNHFRNRILAEPKGLRATFAAKHTDAELRRIVESLQNHHYRETTEIDGKYAPRKANNNAEYDDVSNANPNGGSENDNTNANANANANAKNKNIGHGQITGGAQQVQYAQLEIGRVVFALVLVVMSLLLLLWIVFVGGHERALFFAMFNNTLNCNCIVKLSAPPL